MPARSLGVNSSIARRFLIKANETAFGINFQVALRGTYADLASLIRLLASFSSSIPSRIPFFTLATIFQLRYEPSRYFFLVSFDF